MTRLVLPLLFFTLLLAPVFVPEIDIALSGLFYINEKGFLGAGFPVFDGLSFIANTGARLMALGFFLAALWTSYKQKPFLTLETKAWFFLLIALLVGPGLMANTVFKDHWGRARPREITLFNGTASFSPALVISDQCEKNCSFVSGDASFGFYLPCFAYVMKPKKRRRAFAVLFGVGSLFGLARLISGAHFFSDIMFASALMMITNTATYAALYSKHAARAVLRTLSGEVVEQRSGRDRRVRARRL